MTDQIDATGLFIREGGIPRHTHPRYQNTPVTFKTNDKGRVYAVLAHDCGRCGNTGTYPSSMYDGVCLLCKGRAALIKSTKLYTQAELDRMNATRDKRRAKKDAERVAATEAKAAAVADRREAFMAAWGKWIAVAREAAGHIEFVADILAKAENNAAIERENEKRRYAEQARHLGEVGDKVTVEGEVVYWDYRDGDYGVSYFHVIKDARGTVMYRGSNSLGRRDAVVRFVATVKKLDQSKKDGSAVTVVSRPRKLETLTPAPKRDDD